MVPDDRVLEWLAPSGPAEDWQTCRATHWFSRCGRYRVTRLDPILGDDPEPPSFGACYRGMLRGAWFAVETDASGRAQHRRSLAAAFHAVEVYHRDKCNLAHVRLSSNAAAMVAAAENTGIAREVPVVATKTKSRKGGVIPGFGKIPPAPKGSPASKADLDDAVARTGEALVAKKKGKAKAAPVAPKARKKAKAPVVVEPVVDAVAAVPEPIPGWDLVEAGIEAEIEQFKLAGRPLIDVLDDGGEVAPLTFEEPAAVAPAPASNGKHLSQVEAAAVVLAERGVPMKVAALIEVMADLGLWKSPGGKTPQNTLYSALLRDITVKGAASRFVRTSEGFKLV